MDPQSASSKPSALPEADSGWFDKPENVNRLIYALIACCIALVLADLFYTNDHPHFAVEKIFGFQAWLGFIAFVVIVFLGRLLRMIVSRKEDYYDR